MINDLLKIMQKGNHCSESISEVQNVKGFGDLVELMFIYKKELGKKHFPPVNFVRKHYLNVKDIANMNNFFFDEKHLKIKDIWHVILAGDCDCEYTLSEFKSAHIIVRHRSKVGLILGDYSKANIYLCEGASCEVISQTTHSHINIFNYE